MKAKILQSYIKSKETYEKIYDAMTQDCLNKYEILLADVQANPTEDHIKEMRKLLNKGDKKYSREEVIDALNQGWGMTWVAIAQGISQDRKSKREETINEWIKDAESKDKRVLSVKPFTNLKCSNCTNILRYKWSTLFGDLENDNSSKVLLFYECNTCSKRDAFFEDGTKWINQTNNNCPICGGKRKATIAKDNEGKSFVIYECFKCSSKQVESIN